MATEWHARSHYVAMVIGWRLNFQDKKNYGINIPLILNYTIKGEIETKIYYVKYL